MISRQFKIKKNNDTWKEIKIRKKAVDIYPFTLGGLRYKNGEEDSRLSGRTAMDHAGVSAR